MTQQNLGEAVFKVRADTSEFEEAMQRCLDMVRELRAELDKLHGREPEGERRTPDEV